MSHLTAASHRDYLPSCAGKQTGAGIGVLEIAAISRNAASKAAFLSSGVPFNGRPDGRSRKARRCDPGTPTPVSAAHPIGVGRAVHNLNRRSPTMNTIPAVFNFNSNEVRVVVCDGEPWFVCTDVAKALHYRDAEVASRHLDDDEKGVHPTGVPGQSLTIINESGLYALVLRSRKPEARKFAKWVTSEVLPAIRKTGKFESAAVNAENEPKKIAQPVISDYLQAHISRKTHEIALGQYDAIRGIITEAVQGNLNCGATEASAHDYVDTYGDAASGLTVINTRDIFSLAMQTTQLLNGAGQALETIHHLEKRLGRELYLRKKHGEFGCFGLPESLVESVISAAQERKSA